ncbi:unnamed protein product [Auanema sp. JU1783]|nr:unnamed protein product [Auanema sp. JU1783]
MLILILFYAVLVSSASIFDQTSKKKCVPITISLCKDAPYNYTFYPSSLIQQDFKNLNSQIDHFKPLIKTKCNPNIQFFICSVFAPMCPLDLPQAVRSCRSVCLEVKRDCQSILDEFSIEWPDILDCAKFPEEPDLCMKPAETKPASTSPSYRNGAGVRRPYFVSSCPEDLLDVDSNDPKGTCAYKCGADVMFNSEKKAAAKSWMIMWGTVDLSISLLTFFTFLIDRKRFRYPQRCICYMALCYLMHSIPHVFPYFWSYAQRACDKLVNGHTFLVFSGIENTNCLMSFILTFYFGTASTFWWLMFAFTWYLSAGRKWVPEGVDACASYLHFVAWGASAVLTIIVLVLRRVDASELSGLCGVGLLHPSSLLTFSIIPRLSLMVVGVIFMLCGLASMCRERESFRRRGTDTSKLEKLMIKMLLFCVLYLVPSVTVIVCDSYHYLTMMKWYPVTIGCKEYGGMTQAKCTRPADPTVEIYFGGIMMSLMSSISCSIWILSRKSLQSWKHLIFCGLCGSAPQKPQTSSGAASRPLLEPPTAPPPHPPSSHYLPMSTHSHNIWKTSKVV